jgi:RNA polymerase sigma factor (sigma-70 family)
MKKVKPVLSHSLVSWYNKNKYSEAEILEGIINNNDIMIRYIYKNFFPGIKSMVGSFHNLSLDAEDVFQEGLTRAVINVREHKFNGTSSFYTYLTSICRNVCLKEIKKSAKRNEAGKSASDNDDSESYQDDLIDRITTLKKNMDENCKQIIDLRFGLRNSENLSIDEGTPLQNMRFEEIAKQLNIEADNARQRFRRCFEKFKMVIFNDHLLKELTN